MKVVNILIISLVLFIFTGCSISKQVVGEYYLQQKDYNDGYSYFKEKINSNEYSDTDQYYYARFLIAKGDLKTSITPLKKAIELNPTKSIYHSWLGVVYGNLKQYKNERSSYLKALSFDEKNLQALTYLAHNYLDKKEYKKALAYYNKVLSLSPENQFALYNRSIVLGKLKRTPEELKSWIEYLSFYPSGSLANKAVKSLNKLNDFSYKNHLIGFKNVTLKNITFKPFSSNVDSSSYSSLDVLGRILSKNEKISIHVVSYQLNNKELAKEKVKSIRKYITSNFKEVDKNRLKLSWFDKPRVVKINKKRYILNEDINFITYVKK